MKTNNNLYIFNKNIKIVIIKLIPIKVNKNYVGETKYLPPVSKEWKNTIYCLIIIILLTYLQMILI